MDNTLQQIVLDWIPSQSKVIDFGCGDGILLKILSEQNKTVFKVHDKANKKTIKKNIEKLFNVKVMKVNIINQKTKVKIRQGKKSYKKGYKKAIITLKKGQSIDLTTGI